MLNFVITVREHKKLGCLLVPCIVENADNNYFYKIREVVVPEKLSANQLQYTDVQQTIVKLADNYSDTKLRKILGGKNASTDYLKNISDEVINNTIRPMIEDMIVKIIKLCQENNIKLYFKDSKLTSLFPDDEVNILKYNAEAIFNFVKTNEETQYFLTVSYKNKEISLLNKALFVLSNHPCNIIIDGRLYHFENIDAKKLTPFTTKNYISVAQRVENQYYNKFIKNTIETGALIKAKGFKIVIEKVYPKAILTLDKWIDGTQVFELNFRYNNSTFNANDPKLIKVNFDEKEFKFSKLLRDERFENEVEEAAFNIIGKRISKGLYSLICENKDPEFQKVFAVNFINSHLKQFTEAGIEVELSGSSKSYYTGKIETQTSVKSRNDWFDVNIIIVLDDIKIPFVSLRYYIINNIREFKLPDGRIMILPEEWFEKFKDLFISGSINKNNNTISLHSYQYQSIKSIELSNDIKEKIQKIEEITSNPDKLPSKQPTNVNAVLRPYQIRAFNWLMMMKEMGFGACLADDMGLGKTLCTLSLLSSSPAFDTKVFQEGLFSFAAKLPTLLIVPKSLIYNWIAEAKKFVPHLKILEFTGQNRLDHIKAFPLYDIVIMSYGTLINDIDQLSSLEFNYIVLDESQTIKNSESKTYKCIMKLNSKHKLVLTGTPLENSLTDLWSQINFINPELLGNIDTFKKRFVTPIQKNFNSEVSEKLRHLISPFILRRTKQEVLDDLPDLIEQTILCDMTEQQAKYYEREKSKTRNSIIDIMDNGNFDHSTVFVLQSLTKLRQIACSPSLTDNAPDCESGKMTEIIRAIQNVTSQGHKVLIFSSFVKYLELIAEKLNNSDIEYLMLIGSTNKREEVVNKFNNDNTPVFLISIKAGGTGLNLTSADYVFIVDPWWNPAVEAQAVARAHRIGQKNSVMVYRFISRNTVEEKIQILQRKKANLASHFITEDNVLPPDLKNDVLKILE